MVAFDRDSGVAAEAAIKYFVLGAIASGVLLYGMSIIYGLTGTLDLDELAARLHAAAERRASSSALTFIVVAVAFKLGAVPFHMWVPDVYQGAPDQRDAVHRHGAEDRATSRWRCACWRTGLARHRAGVVADAGGAGGADRWWSATSSRSRRPT